MHEMHRAVDWIYCEFRFCCKSVFYSKTVITFAYELGFRRILYRFVSKKKLDLVQNSVAVFAKFRFAKFGPEDRVFGVLISDVGIA